MAERKFFIDNGFSTDADSEITGNLTVSGTVDASAFTVNGSPLSSGSGGVTTLSGLTDVGSGDTAVNGDMVLYDGSSWGFVNLEDEINTRITASNANTSLTGLTDVGFTGDTVANGDFLLYDDSTSKFGFVNFESEVQTYAQALFPNIQHASYGANVNGKLAVAGGIDMSLGTTLELEMGLVNFSGSTVVLDGDKVAGLDHETVGLDNIENAVYGVNVTGRVAASDGLEVSVGGTIDAQACTVDMRNSTVLFNGATVGGLDAKASTSYSQPSNPGSGDIWFDGSTLTMYVYYVDSNSVGAWVEVGGA